MDNCRGNSDAIFSSEEKDILQEVMNIAFGNAAADLAELIDIHTILSVPDIQLIDFNNLSDYLKTSIPQNQTNSVAGQKFWGPSTLADVVRKCKSSIELPKFNPLCALSNR